jgi:hypothetical protein
VNEETLIKTMELPNGQTWAWYADANIVALSPELDEAGREAAISAVQDHWRRSCLRVVPSTPSQTLMTTPLPGVITEPMDIAEIWAASSN